MAGPVTQVSQPSLLQIHVKAISKLHEMPDLVTKGTQPYKRHNNNP